VTVLEIHNVYIIYACFFFKESLNSNGQQFYQYQQNEQSPSASTHWTQKRLTYGVGNLVPGFRRTRQCGGAKLVNGVSTFSLFIFSAVIGGG
jgi:hypothetical protein